MAQSSSPPLSSDDLGEKGEAKFHDLCSDVALIVNKASRDRGGWDYVVQSPASTPENATLDTRECLWTTYVQVKAIWKSKRLSVRLRLSAAEMLAKRIEPSFVVAIAFDRFDLNNFDIYALELVRENLEAVLKALRRAKRDRAAAVNDVYLTLPLKSAEKLTDPTGAAIKARLEAAHAGGSGTYAVAKSLELKTIGQAHYRGSISFQGLASDDFVDVLLGQKSHPAIISNVVHSRFGIDIPSLDIPSGPVVVKFNPKPLGDCDLVVESRGLKRPVSFRGRFFRVSIPGATGIISKSRIEARLFSVEQFENHCTLTAEFGADTGDVWPIDLLVKFYRVMDAMRSNSTQFRVRCQAIPDDLRFEFEASPASLPDDIELRRQLFEAVRDIALDTGCNLEGVVPGEIFEDGQAIMSVWGFGKKRARDVRIALASLRENKSGQTQSARDILFVDFVDIGGERFAAACRLRFAPAIVDGERLWQSSNTRPVSLKWIGHGESDFKEFVDFAKESSGLSEVLLGEAHEEFVRSALGEVGEF